MAGKSAARDITYSLLMGVAFFAAAAIVRSGVYGEKIFNSYSIITFFIGVTAGYGMRTTLRSSRADKTKP